MPTTRPRHTITETDAVAEALADAAKRWPDERPGGLLLRLVAEGHRAIRVADRHAADRRKAALERTSGALTGVYEPGELDELRRDWPE